MAQSKLLTAAMHWQLGWRDYYQLTKPKVVALLLLTAWVGMMLAQPGLHNGYQCNSAVAVLCRKRWFGVAGRCPVGDLCGVGHARLLCG